MVPHRSDASTWSLNPAGCQALQMVVHISEGVTQLKFEWRDLATGEEDDLWRNSALFLFLYLRAEASDSRLLSTPIASHRAVFDLQEGALLPAPPTPPCRP